jgi:hypothetical protein
MLRFRRALNHLEVREVQLVGRKYTWTNSQANSTMTRIDKAFYTLQWENLYANPVVQALSSAVSDHCPLLLVPVHLPRPKPKFSFECFWIEMDGFKDCVQQAWNRAVPQHQNPLSAFHTKLSRTAKKLRTWSKSFTSQAKVVMAICREVIAQLQKAQENRILIDTERNLVQLLKMRLLGLAAIEKSRAKQKSRITWLKKVMQIQSFST